MGARMTQQFDETKDGKVSREEWDKFFAKADENEDGILDAGELSAALRGRAYNDTAPKVGDVAPKVSATTAKGAKTVSLAGRARPTVLVFGSWT